MNLITTPVPVSFRDRSVTETQNYTAFAALRQNGSVVYWGSNDQGNPDISSIQSSVHSILDGSIKTQSIISAGRGFAAIREDGSAVLWMNYAQPSITPTGKKVTSISSSVTGFAGIYDDGTTFYYTPSTNYQIQTHSLPNNAKPIQICTSAWGFATLDNLGGVTLDNGAYYSAPTDIADNQFVRSYANENSYVFQRANGSLYGVGTSTPSDQNYINVASTNFAFAAIKNDGKISVWGSQTYGAEVPQNIQTLLDSIEVKSITSSVSAFAALGKDGSIASWGHSHWVYTGNDVNYTYQPTSGAEAVSIVSTWQSFAALLKNGSVVAWGGNSADTLPAEAKPFLSSGVIKLAATSTGEEHIGAFAALKADGSVITWGANFAGGDSTSVSSQLSSNVVELFSNGQAFAALKNDGTVVTWGSSASGGDSSRVSGMLSDPNKKVLTLANYQTDESLFLTGTSSADDIRGGEKNDILLGYDGNDILKGGSGSDILNGSAGSDTADFSDKSSSLTITLNAGNSSVQVDGETDTLISIENLKGGSAADSLTGDAAANVLDGGNGNDDLKGGTGSDTLNGGTGSDTADFSDKSSSLTITLNAGNSSVQVDGETDTLISIENLKGGSAADSLTGDAAANVLDGGNGNDDLKGGTGSDTLNGGTGSDTADFSDKSSSLTITLNAGNSSVQVDGETDTLISIENLKGGIGSDKLTGDSVANVLAGGSGNDTLKGGAGSDTIEGGDGSDTADFSDKTTALNITLNSSITSIRIGSETDTLASIENLIGGSGYDKLTGDASTNILNGGSGNDNLFGGAGNDVLIGGTGNDTLIGGLGDDVYFIDDAGDRVSESINQGIDTVRTTLAKCALATNFENLTYTGSNSFSGTGNTFANILNGGSGNDVLAGGDGIDTFNITAGTDTISDLGLGGSDVFIVSSGATANISVAKAWAASNNSINNGTTNITTNGFRINLSAIESGTGFTVTNTGNATSINGSQFADILIGGAGNDNLTGGAGSDKFAFKVAASSKNIDTLSDFNVVEDKIQLSKTVFKGFSAVGSISDTSFLSGAGKNSAMTTAQKLIYDSTSGKLFYDADGSGSTAAIQIALIGNKAALTSSSFEIIS